MSLRDCERVKDSVDIFLLNFLCLKSKLYLQKYISGPFFAL